MQEISHQELIVGKVLEILGVTERTYYEKLADMIIEAPHVFIAGAGRSGLAGRFFAMRLMHCGFDAHVVGDVETPSLHKDDLFIVISSSGETGTMLVLTKKAKDLGGKIALLTSRKESSMAAVADFHCLIGNGEQHDNVQGVPLGTVFELSALIFVETVIAHIIMKKGIAEETMKLRHANLE